MPTQPPARSTISFWAPVILELNPHNLPQQSAVSVEALVVQQEWVSAFESAPLAKWLDAEKFVLPEQAPEQVSHQYLKPWLHPDPPQWLQTQGCNFPPSGWFPRVGAGRVRLTAVPLQRFRLSTQGLPA